MDKNKTIYISHAGLASALQKRQLYDQTQTTFMAFFEQMLSGKRRAHTLLADSLVAGSPLQSCTVSLPLSFLLVSCQHADLAGILQMLLLERDTAGVQAGELVMCC